LTFNIFDLTPLSNSKCFQGATSYKKEQQKTMTKCNKTTDYSSHKYLVNISEVSSKKYFFLFSTFKIISNSELFQRLPIPNQLQERATKTTRKSNKTTDYCSHKYLVNISEVYHRKNIFFNFQLSKSFRIQNYSKAFQDPTTYEKEQQTYRRLLSKISCKYF